MGELAPRWVEAGHRVVVYCRKAEFTSRPTRWRGVQLVYLPNLRHRVVNTLSHSLVATVHAALTPSDVVLVWNAANGPFGWLLKARGKRAAINVDGMEWLRPKWRGFGQHYFKWAARMATRAFPVVITDADEMKRLYLKEFGVDTTYIAYGANIEPSERPEVLIQYGVQPRSYYLVASRLVPDNNADLIVRGFIASKSTRNLAIAGGADYKGNSMERAFIDSLKKMADERVLFLGHIEDPDHIKELHHHCYGYIHGHQHGGINPSLLKALGYSNLVFALDTPFNAEVLSNGEYGLLFPKDHSQLTALINELDSNPGRAQAFREKAAEPIRERFNWDRIAQRYLDVFAELTER